MSTPIDVALTQDTTDGTFDLSIVAGDFVSTNGFDTALPMSLWCERMADESEVLPIDLRRGWWGNLLDADGFEIGSKLWLLDQRRRNQSTLNAAVDYVRDGLQWLVDDGHLVSIDVSAQFISEGISITITLYRSNGATDRRSFVLWENTSGI